MTDQNEQCRDMLAEVIRGELSSCNVDLKNGQAEYVATMVMRHSVWNTRPTPSSADVERVAEAIHREESEHGGAFWELPKKRQQDYRNLARAAIAAMKGEKA